MRLFDPIALRGVALPNRIVVSPMCQYSADGGARHRLAPGPLGAAAPVRRGHVHHRGHRGHAGRAGSRPAASGCGTTPPRTRSATSWRARGGRRRRCRSRSSSRTRGARRRRARPWEGGALIPPGDGRLDAAGAVGDRRRRGRGAPAALDAAGLDRARRRVRRRRRGAPSARHRRHRAAHGARLPAARVPVAAREPARRRLRRQRSTIASASRSRCSTRCARRGPPTGRWACACRPPTGSTAAGRWSRRVELAQRLKARGCDWIDVSTGGVSPLQKIAPAPGYPGAVRARDPRRRPGSSTMAVGLITDPRAGRRHRRGGRCRHGRARPRLPVGPALAVARGGGAGRAGGGPASPTGAGCRAKPPACSATPGSASAEPRPGSRRRDRAQTLHRKRFFGVD